MTSDFHQLQPHPASPPMTVVGVQIALDRVGTSEFWLRYIVFGPLDDLVLPDPATPARADELWKTTCFELFVRPDGAASYDEFNFAPSSEWAAYRFSSYRADGVPLLVPPPRQIDLSAASDLFDMEVVLEIELPERASLSLTAVVEETSGHKSYWALAHPPSGPPDFHHPDCFVLDLPPAPRA